MRTWWGGDRGYEHSRKMEKLEKELADIKRQNEATRVKIVEYTDESRLLIANQSQMAVAAEQLRQQREGQAFQERIRKSEEFVKQFEAKRVLEEEEKRKKAQAKEEKERTRQLRKDAKKKSMFLR